MPKMRRENQKKREGKHSWPKEENGAGEKMCQSQEGDSPSSKRFSTASPVAGKRLLFGMSAFMSLDMLHTPKSKKVNVS